VSDQCRDSYCASIIEIADIQRLKWVNFGLSRPTAATSAFRGKADANDAKADMPAAMSAVEGRDAMRLKDAASCSFDCFNNDLKERSDDTVSSIDLQRTVYLCGPGAEQEQLALGDPGSGAR
jgi:hypothetical protein